MSNESNLQEALAAAEFRAARAELAVEGLARTLAIQTRKWIKTNPEDFSAEYWMHYYLHNAEKQIKLYGTKTTTFIQMEP